MPNYKVEKYTIRVTQKDIEDGKKWDCGACPIALAARRVFNAIVCANDERIIVSQFKLGEVPDDHCPAAYKKSTYTRYRLPKKARAFVLRYDDNEQVKPFSFTVSRGKRCPPGEGVLDVVAYRAGKVADTGNLKTEN